MATTTTDAPRHIYGLELNETDPRSAQPSKIRLELKPHQTAALAKALQMEKLGSLRYKKSLSSAEDDPDDRTVTFHANVGILGDIPSYGKTLTALAIIAQNLNTAEGIHHDTVSVHSQTSRDHGGYCKVFSDRGPGPVVAPRIRSTLVVVPHGPVFMQWKKAIETQTTMRVLVLENLVNMRRACPSPDVIQPPTLVQPVQPRNPQRVHEAAAYDRARDAYTAAIHAAFAPMVTLFESYDAVLIKNTTLKVFIGQYISRHDQDNHEHAHPFYGWDRVIVDEAHDILCSIPFIRFGFAWLISATYSEIPRSVSYGSSCRGFGSGLRPIVNNMYLNYLLVKSNRAFVTASFQLPPITDITVLCELERQLAAVQAFLSPYVLERVNAGDIAGAIQALGGKADTEENIAELVTRDLQREIHNRTLHRDYVLTLDLEPEVRAGRLASVEHEIRRLNDRLTSLIERITQLNDKECAICGDTFVNPIFLKCTHVHCADCLMQWLRSPAGGNGHTKACPTCREPIKLDQLIAITNAAPAPAAAPVPDPAAAGPSNRATAATPAPAAADDGPPRPVSKVDTLLRIIRSNPTGRFLVFSRVDMWPIHQSLTEAGIITTELKGTTGQMMAKLESFKNNTIRVILLNTRHAGSGIEITCATDVVLYHTMGQDAVQAIGRANRVGRTESLRVHRLVYPHEVVEPPPQVGGPPPPQVGGPPPPQVADPVAELAPPVADPAQVAVRRIPRDEFRRIQRADRMARGLLIAALRRDDPDFVSDDE